MHTHSSGHRNSAGFFQSGVINLLLLAFIAAAVLNLALGSWKVAAAMLAPLSVLFIWVQLMAPRSRCQVGDRIRVTLGPHSGKEGVIQGANEAGTRFTVQLSSADHSDPIDFSGYQISKVRPDGVSPPQ